MLARRIGGFECIEEIGRGGMGVVYRARQISLDRQVALKMLLPLLGVDEAAASRFRMEAKVAARINHPNLVRVYDVGQEGDKHYFAMELVEGESLSALIGREGAMEYLQVAVTGCQVAAGLGALHGAGVIHRDVKPSNILVRPDQVVKITDFGVARLHGAQTRLTAAGQTVGTANYMSPEQARGEAQDGRSDIYSLGVVLYEMLAGQAPFSGDTPLVVMRKHCDEEPPSIRRARADIPDRLAGVVGRCLSKDPEERHQTAEALAAELDHVRLELEFSALSAEGPVEGGRTLYSTRTVMGLEAELKARQGMLGRMWSGLKGLCSSLGRLAERGLDRDALAVRRASAQMEEALAALAVAKQQRHDDGTVAELQGRCREARAEHERLSIRLELKEARAAGERLAHQVPGRRRMAWSIRAGVALLLVAALVHVLWREGPDHGETPTDTETEQPGPPAAEIVPQAVDFERSDYALAEHLYALAAADFDADGLLDIAISTYAEDTLILLWGEAGGRFRSPQSYPVPNSLSLATGDFTGDGVPDLVMTSGRADPSCVAVCTWYRDSTSPTRRWHRLTTTTYGKNTGPGHIVTAGINGDGRLGLAATTALSGGSGGPASADFDGDGRLDVAVPDTYNDRLTIFHGRPGGEFVRAEDYAVTGSRPRFILATELNGDGLVDLAVYGDKLNLFYGLPHGGFDQHESKVTFGGTRVSGTAAGDIDGDGLVDLVMTATFSQGSAWRVPSTPVMRVLYNQSDGRFAVVDYSMTAERGPVLTGDFNGDGRTDIATISNWTKDRTLTILMNRGPRSENFNSAGD